jgi:hypothetical protein
MPLIDIPFLFLRLNSWTKCALANFLLVETVIDEDSGWLVDNANDFKAKYDTFIIVQYDAHKWMANETYKGLGLATAPRRDDQLAALVLDLEREVLDIRLDLYVVELTAGETHATWYLAASQMRRSVSEKETCFMKLEFGVRSRLT